MRDLVISGRADPAFVGAFRSLIQRLVRSVKASAKEPIEMYLAGGVAVHLYTGARMTDDVDAAFNRKLLVPSDLAVIYRDSAGHARSVYFDATYNESYALLHEDAHRDSLRLRLDGIKGARICVLQPVDLAVSKLARFGEIDRKDIRQLAEAGLITAGELRKRAAAALPAYVGNPDSVRASLDLACRDIEALKGSRNRVDSPGRRAR